MRVLEMIASGVAATALLDIWQRVLHAATGIPPSNWALVGRWFTQAARGTFFHKAIADVAAAPNELAIGWIGHYAVGILYGFIYVPLMRNGLGLEPSLLNGLVFGAASVVVPWFFFMPAMGSGVLGANTPDPRRACLLAFIGHVVFGLGLALGAMAV
jgi:hypothetical protein